MFDTVQNTQYFLGIPPPDSIKEKIVSFQKTFPTNKFHRVVEPHITVKAQGGLVENGSWLAAVKTVIENHSKFEVLLKEVDDFGGAVLFLKPAFSKELARLHNALLRVVQPSQELIEKYFEGDQYHPHLTLAGTAWGMTKEEVAAMKEKAKSELLSLRPFGVSFVRIYHQKSREAPYETFLDIPLKS